MSDFDLRKFLAEQKAPKEENIKEVEVNEEEMEETYHEGDMDETDGYVESMGPMLDKVLKQLIAVWDEWKQGPMTEPGMVPFAKKDLIRYIDSQIKEQEEEVIDEQFFDDLEAAKEYARKESEQGFVQHVNKHPKGGFRVEDWLDGSNTVASYEGGDVLEEEIKENAFKSSIKEILNS